MHRWALRRHALFFRAALCLFVLLLAGACDVVKPKAKPLRLGVSDWPGNVPFYGAAKLGHFGGSQVEIKRFGSNFDKNRAFAQGHLDVLATPLFDALRIADDGVPFKIILIFDYSSGGDGIVARKEIGAVRDLKGKRVSAEVGAITHFVLLSALRKAGLAEADVEIVNLSAPEGAEAFARGKLDAATLWDPHLSRQATAEGAHKIFTTKEIPGEIIDVLIVHKAAAEARPEDVTNIVKGWDETIRAWRANPTEIEAVMAKASNQTPEGLRADLAGLELLDLAKNSELLKASAPGQSVWTSYEESVRFMVQHKLLKHAAPDAKELVEPRFIERARGK